MFNLLYGNDSKATIKIFTTNNYEWTQDDHNTFNKIANAMNASKHSPGKFFKTNYGKVVEFCAGSKKEADILYAYFDKLNQFSYSTGWQRRTVRTRTYINPVSKVRIILYAAYYMQIYNCSLADFLMNNMSEELCDYKAHAPEKLAGLEDLIAAHIDAGDKDVKNALITIITGENNVGTIDTAMIRGIFKSSDIELHKLLGQLLLAARLQEGLRQAICENMDCGTIESFKAIFDVIAEHDLLRYSAVRRAVATWIGIIDPDHLTRSSNKTFKLMHEVVNDKKTAVNMVKSDDAMSILVGLWGLGFYEIEDAIGVMNAIIDSGSVQQKRVATYYNKALGDRELQNRFVNKVVESESLDIELMAGIIEEYMSGCMSEAAVASGMRIGYGQKEKEERRPVNLSLWFPDKQTAVRHYDILMDLFWKMEHKKYTFNPYVFPWYFTNLKFSDILLRLMVIANGLEAEKVMDALSERISDLDSQDNSRVTGVRLLLSDPKTPKRRESLINMLGDKETYTRKEAFKIAEDVAFTPEDYDKMCELLRFKAADLRVNIISLIKRQNAAGIDRSLGVLLNDKREDVRLAGLDILRGLIHDEDSVINGGETGKCSPAELSVVINKHKATVVSMSNPTEREKIIIREIFGNTEYIKIFGGEAGDPEAIGKQADTSSKKDGAPEALYSASDTITAPNIICNDVDYPIFIITREELDSIFTKLDNLIEKHKDEEFKLAYGDTVRLGNLNYLPILKYGNDVPPEEKYPLLHIWKKFYEEEINNPHKLMAMILSLASYTVIVGYGNGLVTDEKYNKYLKGLMTDIFGEAVVSFDVNKFKYGKVPARAVSSASSGGDLFMGILMALKEIYCDLEQSRLIGEDVIEYLINNVPEDMRIRKMTQNLGWTVRDVYVSPLNTRIVDVATMDYSEKWDQAYQFNSRFWRLYALKELFLQEMQDGPRNVIGGQRYLSLTALDFVIAAYNELISEEQMYRTIFEEGELRNNIQNLFMIYRTAKYPYLRKQLEKYGLEDEKLEAYVRKVANTVADSIVTVECRRGDTPTQYSEAVSSIEFFYGIDHLVMLLKALGKEKFVRKDIYGYRAGTSRKGCLSHLVSVCHPLPTDTAYDLKKALEGTKIDEKRLIEVAMYAPQWIDLIEELLDFKGLKSGAYYFMAHMNDQYNRDERKFATIARFTPLEKEELFNGAFDIAWFREAYSTLGEKKFQMLYDAAKYTSDGSKHSRARKYADATLGKVSVIELEAEISEKRNKDSLMSYALIPLEGKNDMLRRYEYIQKFRKESQQFGSQRKASEGTACDMAMRNLATNAGFNDVTRLTLAMETELVESLKGFFEWKELGDSVSVRIQIGADGKPDVLAKKGEKNLASIPAAYKKHEYVLELKEANKKFRAQYSRTVKMFELAMEEREYYSFEELAALTRNPVVCPIVENLVFISENSEYCGLVTQSETLSIIDSEGKVIGIANDTKLRVAHPFDLYKNKSWTNWQKVFVKKQQEENIRQPFRQVFRELYVKLDEEEGQADSRMFAGSQIQPKKTIATLKNRRWIVDQEMGLNKVFYKDNILVNMYAIADWFAPSDIEAPTVEFVAFADRKTFEPIKLEDVPDIVYSEAMRDVDLAVSVAHAGNVDPEASHSTIEMRKVIAECNIDLFGLKNVHISGTHAVIEGSLGEYTVHLGSGVVHMVGVHQLSVLPVHSQHRGRIFLPFIDDDPKTAEIISKILLFAEDKKIKDPYILEQMK